MSSLALNTGLKALLTAQSKLETIGHNVSNASTAGYSRQSLEVGTSPTMRLHGLLQGTGVQANVVRRTVDSLLQTRLSMQGSLVSRIDARVSGLSQAEALFASGSGGLDQLFKNFFSSLSTLSTTPEDTHLRSNAVQSAANLSSKFNALADGSLNIGADAIGRIQAQVGVVNQLAERISRLNGQILSTESAGAPANDLRDARERAVSELAKLTDVKTVEDGRGALRVLVAGQTLVSPVGFKQLEVTTDGRTDISIRVEGGNVDMAISGGEIGGLLSVLRDFLPGLKSDTDALARNFILEMNRAHSTGMPSSGPMRALVGSSRLVDQDSDGQVTDELLSNSGLPFDATSGDLFVNITDLASGAMTKHRVPIDAARTTVQDFLTALSRVPNLSASVDGQGRVEVQADSGFGFDFSPRLDVAPDDIASFGGGRASIAGGASEPYALALGSTLDFNGPLGAFSVAFQPNQFQSMGQATAEELAAALNSDANFQSNGLIANTVGGTLVVQSSGSGTSQSFTVTGGAASAVLGWAPGTTVTGKSLGVNPKISGTYSGAANDAWTFRPSADGTIGSTVGLKVDVFDQNGVQVAQLDVGANYQPGSEIEVRDGVKVAFGLGDVSAAHNDLFRLDVLADSDTADVLPALGINTLFVGNDAASMEVRADLLENPELFASSFNGASGDGGNVLRLLQKSESGIEGLAGLTFESNLTGVVGGVALELSSAREAGESEEFMRQSLESRRDQVSGVNVDEELARMIEAQQAYSAAGEYMRVVNQLSSDLFNIL